MTEREERRWPPILILIAAGLLLHVHQLEGYRTYRRDILAVFVPVKHYLAEVLRSGQLPQWWPWDAAGTPFLAQPQFSVFHPTTLLYLVLPFWAAFTAQDMVGTLLTLTGAYALARTLGQPRISAVIAGCLYAGNGFVMGLTEASFMKLAAGTMPWYLASLIVARRRGGPWLVVPAVAMGLGLLAGDPQTNILAAGAGIVLLMAEAASWRSWWLGCLSPAAGAVLAAVQLLPSLMVASETDRAVGPHLAGNWILDWQHVIGMIVPVETDGWALHMTFGLAGLALAGGGVAAARRDRRVAALLVLTAVSIWLALGDGYGLNSIARHIVPVWDKLRYPIKSVVLATLALAILAGEGFRQLRESQRRGAVFGAAATGAMLVAVTALNGFFTGFPRGAVVILVPGVAVACAAVLLREQPRIAAALVAAQALTYGLSSQQTLPPNLYASSPIADALHKEGVGLTGPAFEGLFVDPTLEERPWHVTRAAGGQATQYGAMTHLPVLTSYNPATPLRFWRMWDPSLQPSDLGRFASVFGVAYLVVPEAFIHKATVFMGVDRVVGSEPDFGFTALHLRRSLPRAYVVRRAEVADSPEAAARVLRSPQFRPGRVVLIEGAEPRPDWSGRPESVAQDAEIVSRTNSTVTLDADLPWDGFVVLNESYFSGWTATVDGHPAPVLVANGFVRAVEAPAGKHRVEFSYVAPGLVEGGTVSAIGWAIVLAVIGFAGAHSHRRTAIQLDHSASL